MGTRLACAGVAASLVICCGAKAAPQVFSFAMPDDPLGHSASASFEFSAGQLHIILKNTSTQAPRSDDFRGPDSGNVSWLTGLFFNIEGTVTSAGGGTASADMVWAESGGGFSNNFPGGGGDPDPSAYWAYRNDLSPSNFGEFAGLFGGGDQQYGLGASGLSGAGFDLFGPSDILVPGDTPGENQPPDGSSGGVLPDLSVVPDLALPSGHEENAFVDGMIEFWLDIGGTDLVVTDVAFVWGTDLNQGLVLIPLPAALPLGLAGLAGVVIMRRRTARGKQAV